MKAPRVVVLPLDSRPCNRRFPAQLLRAAGGVPVCPSAAAMDWFDRAADWARTEAFHMSSAARAEALAVSIDHLCYGSLLASREPQVPREEAERRLTLLAELKRRQPALRIHAYSVVMRSSISALHREDLPYYHLMTEYSQAHHRAALGDEADRARLEQIKSRLPSPLLEKYHRVRARNHGINLACIGYAAEGVLDSLLLLQEDAQPFGIHRIEQQCLLRAVEESGAAPGVRLHNGTDEAGMMAAMKCLAEQRGANTTAAVCYLLGDRGGFTALYEDRPFRENLGSHLAYLGIGVADGAENVLAVCSPPGGVQLDAPAGDDDERAAALAARNVAKLVAAGKRVYLLDAQRANGGSGTLLRAVERACGVMGLWGYASWNTTSNALGTALAQMVSDSLSGRKNNRFLMERLLDDFAYQGAVREPFQGALARDGEDIYHLSDRAAAARGLAQRHHRFVREEAVFAACRPRYTITLPWPRTFEADIRVNSLQEEKER